MLLAVCFSTLSMKVICGLPVRLTPNISIEDGLYLKPLKDPLPYSLWTACHIMALGSAFIH